MHYTLTTKVENLQNFLKIPLGISRIAEPILGLFVLIWMHFSYWMQYDGENLNFEIFLKKVWKFWPVVCSRHPHAGKWLRHGNGQYSNGQGQTWWMMEWSGVVLLCFAIKLCFVIKITPFRLAYLSSFSEWFFFSCLTTDSGVISDYYLTETDVDIVVMIFIILIVSVCNFILWN